MLTNECATKLAESLSQNTTLKSLFVNIFMNFSKEINFFSVLFKIQLDDNNFTNSGVTEILDSLNNDKSGLEFLSIKNIKVQKYITVFIELIQMRRKFSCIYGPVIHHKTKIDASR
jgi:hypothetical protein